VLHLSLRFSTSSPSCSSSSCSSVHARTSVRLRRGSLTVTSKGTCVPLYFPMRFPLPFPSTECPYHFRHFSFAHPLIVCSGLPTVTRTRFLGIFFMSARIGESHPSYPHILRLRLLSDQPKPVFALCAGERLSPYVALACIAMAVRMILS
jgi:hypothetical protein